MTESSNLLVDGYNVLNSWTDFEKMKNASLEHARDRLVDILANYGAFQGCEVTVVFDAYAVDGAGVSEEKAGVWVVFTSEGETADSYIEKAAYDMVRLGRKVFVITGDGHEQLTALGVGAYRLTARELLEDCRRVEREIAVRVENGRPLAGRQEVAGRLDPLVAGRLEGLRRLKK